MHLFIIQQQVNVCGEKCPIEDVTDLLGQFLCQACLTKDECILSFLLQLLDVLLRLLQQTHGGFANVGLYKENLTTGLHFQNLSP